MMAAPSSMVPQEWPRLSLLGLPIEIRREIYSYLLPSTINIHPRLNHQESSSSAKKEYKLTFVPINLNGCTGVWKILPTRPNSSHDTGHDIVWRRGSVVLLRTNRQIHEECATMIYGESTFVIDVTFDSVHFRYRWLVSSSNLMPGRSYSFLDHFSARNLMRIKNYVVNIEHVDDYTGMIKYNHRGQNLAAGILVQVSDLVELLAGVPYLNRVSIQLVDGDISRVRFPSGRVHRVQDERNFEVSQKVLEPWRRVYGVRYAVVKGVSEEFGAELEKSMMASRGGTD